MSQIDLHVGTASRRTAASVLSGTQESPMGSIHPTLGVFGLSKRHSPVRLAPAM